MIKVNTRKSVFNNLCRSLQEDTQDWVLGHYTLDNEVLGIEIWVEMDSLFESIILQETRPFIWMPTEFHFTFWQSLKLRKITKNVRKKLEEKQKKEILTTFSKILK